MKKILALILLLGLTLGMVACGGEGTEAEVHTGAFLVGYGEALMNPVESVPIGGYGNTSTRMSQDIADDVYIRCIALTDEEENSVLIITLDSVRAYSPAVVAMGYVADATGVPYENILVNASHSHSTPDMSNGSEPSILRYNEYFQQQMVKAAVAAMADRMPAEIYYGTSETEGLSWIRHYLMDDGSYAGDSFGDWDNQYAVGHTAEPDTTMHVLKFAREGSKDVVLVNWRAHPGLTGGAGKSLYISSDFVGPFRDCLEDAENCHAMYLQGHAGNTNPGSRIKSEVEYSDYKEHGSRLAGYAQQAMQDMKPIASGLIKTKRIRLEAKIDHSMDHMAAQARVLSSLWTSTNDRALVIEQGKPYGIRSPYHAGAIVTNSQRAETEEIELNALCIGDSIGLTAGPAELFDRNSMAIEEASPFEVTLCLGYTNGHLGYIPADYVWEYTSYETDITRFERGTAELIERTMLSMLEELKNG